MMRKQLHQFCRAWKVLASVGACDEVGSREYHRVARSWLAAGCPEPIGPFIVRHANTPPAATLTYKSELPAVSWRDLVADDWTGQCVICLRPLTTADWQQQLIVAHVGPSRATCACSAHFEEGATDYDGSIRKFSAAVAMQYTLDEVEGRVQREEGGG
jgi:hypothetical protein